MDTSSQIHRFSEVADIQQLVQRFGFEVSYTQVSPGQLDVEAYEIRVGDCLVFREQFGCHMVAHGTSTPHGYGVMMAQSGVVRFFGNEVSLKKIVLLSPGCEIDAVGFPGLRTLHFALPKDRVAAAAVDWNVELIQAPRALVVEPGIDRLHHLKALFDQVAEILDSRDLAPWDKAKQDLVDIFVGLFDIAAFQGRSPAHSNGRVAEHALRVRSYIQSSPLDQLDLASLAGELGVGRHHLNRCFREHYNVSIREFVQLCRLHRARDLLMERAKELSVTEAAYSCGFNHLGRFSAGYKQLFGETPRQTLRKSTQESQLLEADSQGCSKDGVELLSALLHRS